MPERGLAPSPGQAGELAPMQALTGPRRRFCVCAALLLGGALWGRGGEALAAGAGPGRAADADFWQLLAEGGMLVWMRHAQTEAGIGDPPGFRIGDCSSQRNLNALGRQQAKRVQQAFAERAVRLAGVGSSAWCRCTDTATLAFGQAPVWPELNSFFQGGDGPAQTRALLQRLQREGPRAGSNLALVTHQVNISAATGQFAASGELLLTRPPPAGATAPAQLQVLARWRPGD